MRTIILIFFTTLITSNIFAQDIITKKTGEDIECKVTEIDLDVVKYKKSSNPDGPNYSILKKDIFRIKYANGEIEVFKTEESSRKVTKGNVVNENYKKLEPFVDPRDGNTYKIVQIYDQVWFAENLNYETEESICSKPDNNCKEFGRRYYFNEAISICPEGWHLASDEEWMKLETNLGMLETEAKKSGWRGTHPGQGRTLMVNGETGFDVKLCYGCFALRDLAYYWTSTLKNKRNAFTRVFANRQSISRAFLPTNEKNNLYNTNLLFVRCVKD